MLSNCHKKKRTHYLVWKKNKLLFPILSLVGISGLSASIVSLSSCSETATLVVLDLNKETKCYEKAIENHKANVLYKSTTFIPLKTFSQNKLFFAYYDASDKPIDVIDMNSVKVTVGTSTVTASKDDNGKIFFDFNDVDKPHIVIVEWKNSLEVTNCTLRLIDKY